MSFKELAGVAGTLLLAGGVVFGYIRGFVTGEQLVVAVAALGLPSPLPLLQRLLGKKTDA